MRVCKRCIQPDTRPGIQFDAEGICPPCRFAAEHEKIDWKKRRRELEKLADFGRKRSVSGYDCIVSVSGGKDSTRQAMYVRDELGLKPLLVSCVYPPEHVTERGVHNLANLIELGFDCITATPSPDVWKKMVYTGFYKHGNLLKSCEMALYITAPKVAIAYHIPLICLGENPAITIGALEVRSISGNANRMKHSNTLAGGPESVKTEDMTEHDLYWYRYPSDEEMAWAGMKIFYLGYYVKDFNKFKNAEFSIAHGLEVRRDSPENTGNYYDFESLDNDFMLVNQMLKYFKYGFGRTTDQLSEAIRLGLASREKAIAIARRYDGNCSDKYIKRFCDYIGITMKEFWRVADSYRNRKIWEKDKRGRWQIRPEYQL
ncbi:MAG: N-acetyl sugar amidotransferase [Parcubacteria group bacterium]|nr:N-acetyl sugar amidotransferase [Parcubacteria group bacterium]